MLRELSNSIFLGNFSKGIILHHMATLEDYEGDTWFAVWPPWGLCCSVDNFSVWCIFVGPGILSYFHTIAELTCTIQIIGLTRCHATDKLFYSSPHRRQLDCRCYIWSLSETKFAPGSERILHMIYALEEWN